jgi:hypothetical protein
MGSVLEVTVQRLLAGDVKAESESELVAAQDQTLQTKYRATKISQPDQTVPHHIIMPSTATIVCVCVLNCTLTYGRK